MSAGRRALWGGALLLGLPLLAAAQTGADCPPQSEAVSAAQAVQGMREAVDRGFLWRVTRDGRDSYLYGTLHVAQRSWMFTGPQVTQALRGSDSVALELDMQDADILRRVAAGLRADPAEFLAEPLAGRLRAQLESACLSLPAMAALSPVAQLVVLMTLVARREGLDPAYGIDSFISGFAHAIGKKVISLETPESQIALVKGEPRTALERLAQGLDQLESDRARPMLVHISRLWERGDAAELARYEEWCDCARTEDERAALKRLLDDRNPSLADQIDALHASGARVFAAVGALHMVGPLGLPALLAGRGYQLHRYEWTR